MAGYETVTKQLLEARCNIDLQVQDGESALYNTAANGHTFVAKQLIEARCNIDAQKKNGVSPLFIAAEKGTAPPPSSQLL
jgi:ankyrin repeat protein